MNESDEKALEVLRSRFKVDLDCTPKKKPTKTKIARPNGKKDTHATWMSNYEIVKDACNIILSQMVEKDSCLRKESGDNERLPWSVFVGHEVHHCEYLQFGKKLSYPRLITLATTYEGPDLARVAKSVHKFVSNTRSDRIKNKLPEWKRDLLNELEFDILK